MRYGGDLKLTQYFFAPKDDPYHNKKWRELYPEEKLAEIRELDACRKPKQDSLCLDHPPIHEQPYPFW